MASRLAEPPSMIGQTLGHYRLLEKIGAGGMGVVYRAHDEHLKRDVAIKVLPSGTLADETGRKLFHKEALALSKLNHPNIEAVYDFDTQDGIDFLVMEYIPGQTLSEKLAAGPLPEKEIAKLGTQLAEGLEAAHQQHLVHRDLKPGNLLVTPEDRLKILDFGLAKLVRASGDGVSTEGFTETPGVAGTLAYMAPEQLQAEPVDGRADIHAAGAVLYEMATGQRPFAEVELSQLIGAILRRSPVPPTTLNPKLSPELARIIGKCTEKDPENRYQSAKELAVDLRHLAMPAPMAAAEPRHASWSRWVLAIVGALVVIFILLVGFNVRGLRGRLVGRAGRPHVDSLAVLPLKNLSEDLQQEYFADGMTEALIAELSKIGALKKVTSRTSVMRFKNTKLSAPEIARELGVDGLIEGSALKVGDTVRITVQLIHGATDTHLWANSFDRKYENILALHSDVARAIAGEINVAITPDEVVNAAKATRSNPEAFDYYLHGNEYRNRSDYEKDVRVAVQMYQKATELDPDFALAYAALSEAHGSMWWFYYDRTKERVAQAKAAVDRALRLRPDLSEAHRALGFYSYWCQLDYDRALHEFAIAQKTKPNDSLISLGIANVLRRQGKVEQALTNFKKAAALNPLSASVAGNAGETCALMRNSEEAVRWYDLAAQLSPDLPEFYAYKAGVYLRVAGDTGKARSTIEAAQRLGLEKDPEIAYSRSLLDLYDGRLQEALVRLSSESWEALESQFWLVPKAVLQGQLCQLMMQPQLARSHYDVARKMLEGRVRQRPEEAMFHSALGIAYAGLGRKQEALREAKAGVQLLPVSKEAYRGFYRVEDLARVYVMVGDHESALDQLEYLMSIPGDLGVGALRLDPTWRALRSHPRYQELIRRHSG